MAQSRRDSALEAVVNTFTGFWVSIAIGQYYIYPSHGYEVTFVDNLQMTALFVIASLIRAYLWRRWFTAGWVKRFLTRASL